MNCIRHKCPFSDSSETNSLTHRALTHKHTWQRIPSCLCAGGLINYSLIHHHHQNTRVHTCSHLSLKFLLHLPLGFGSARSSLTVTLSHPNTVQTYMVAATLWHGRQVRVCVRRGGVRLTTPSWYLLVLDSCGGRRDLYLALPADYHTHVQLALCCPRHFANVAKSRTQQIVGLNRSRLPFQQTWQALNWRHTSGRLLFFPSMFGFSHSQRASTINHVTLMSFIFFILVFSLCV